jgi:hypothetical protein
MILVTLFISSFYTVNASNPQTVIALADTYIEVYTPDYTFGREPYLKVADSNASISFTFLMFNLSGISYDLNASSEIKLRLYCLNVTSPHFIGVHWCLNNTWNEETLTFEPIINFSVSNYPENVVSVSSSNNWHEWIVTDSVSGAMQQMHSDMVTFVLRVESSHAGNDYVFFYSKDQNFKSRDYRPQLVFSYKSYVINPLDTYLKIISVSVVVAGVIFVAYRFSRKRKREKHSRKSRFQRRPVGSIK